MAIIEVKHFNKSFDGHAVHKDVSFRVEKGECLGLVGGSGIGKSVVLRSLIGLEKPTSGEIWIEGEEISKLKERDLTAIRKKVAYVFQNGALFDSMSVYDNLAYPLREHTAFNEDEIQTRIHDQLEEFGLLEAEGKLPAELSGGMQKRVGLARAMMIGPKVILYDEPTAGLDPYNTLKIRETVLRLKKKGVTSVFVTHDMPTAIAVCDRFVMLGEGRVLDERRADELSRKDPGPLERFITGDYGGY
ncbi:MAG: ATP-binding cassette domain-containing protein [Bdellovibrionales bacterium]|nr:ATP-binding cassette domain-containing protein [Bdellovibrionales bacterium]